MLAHAAPMVLQFGKAVSTVVPVGGRGLVVGCTRSNGTEKGVRQQVIAKVTKAIDWVKILVTVGATILSKMDAQSGYW